MQEKENKPAGDGVSTLFEVEGATRFEDTQYYKDLVENCSVVTCAHTAYFWAGEVIDVFGLPAIVGKMPQKIWVGLEPKSEPGIEYGVYKEYDPSNHSFRDVRVQETTRRQTIAFLNEWVGQMHAHRKINSQVTKDGYRMHQFAETLYGRSHVAPKISGGRAVAEATAIAVAFLGLKEDELKRQQTVTTLRIPCQHEIIDELLYLAWELAAIGYGGYHGASDIASAFMDSFLPLFVCRSKPVLEVPPGDDEPRPKKVRELNFEARSMPALGLSDLPLWSLDIAVVFSGQNKRTLAGLDVARVLRDTDNLVQQVANLPNISMNLDSKPSDTLLKIGEMLTLTCLDLILRVLRSHYAYELINRLNKTINQYRKYMGILGLTSPIMEKLMLFLEDEGGRALAQVGRPGLGIKPTSEGIGGGILVILPAPESRAAFTQLIEYAKKPEKLTPEGLGVRVDYASWEHGFPSAGVRIIHCPSLGVYGPYSRPVPPPTRVTGLDRPFTIEAGEYEAVQDGKKILEKLSAEQLSIKLQELSESEKGYVIVSDDHDEVSYRGKLVKIGKGDEFSLLSLIIGWVGTTIRYEAVEGGVITAWGEHPAAAARQIRKDLLIKLHHIHPELETHLNECVKTVRREGYEIDSSLRRFWFRRIPPSDR
jgi:hypothetical protein